MELLKKNSIPYIVFDKANDTESSYVTNDDFSAMLEGTEFLLSKGIKRIDLLLGNKSPTNDERESGAKKAYIKNKSKSYEHTVISKCDHSFIFNYIDLL